MSDDYEAIPQEWFVDNDGQANVLDVQTVGRLCAAAQAVVKQWQFARVDHQPLIEELARLREALDVQP